MGGYVASKTVPNLARKKEYIKSHDIVNKNNDYYDTADNDFWSLLAKENQLRHKDSKGCCKNGNCVEARQLIIGIPQNNNIIAKELCDIFKNKYGVECCCAIHTKKDKQGNVTNKHAHLIFADRQKLKEPIVVNEVKTSRTYYYDAKGKKCKKSEAVKVVPKGTITTKGKTQYFSGKIDKFGNMKFVNEVKDLFLNKVLDVGWNLQQDKENRELNLQTKHIGYKNVNSKFISDNNELKLRFKASCELTYYYKNLDEQKNFKTLKEYKKSKLKEYDVSSFDTKKFDENCEKLSNFINKTQNEYNNSILTETTNKRSEIIDVSINDNIKKEVQQMNEDNMYAYIEASAETAKDLIDKVKEDDSLLDRVSKIFDKVKEKFKDLKHFLSFQKFFTAPEYRYDIRQDELGYTYFVGNNVEDTGIIQEQTQNQEIDNSLER